MQFWEIFYASYSPNLIEKMFWSVRKYFLTILKTWFISCVTWVRPEWRDLRVSADIFRVEECKKIFYLKKNIHMCWSVLRWFLRETICAYSSDINFSIYLRLSTYGLHKKISDHWSFESVNMNTLNLSQKGIKA